MKLNELLMEAKVKFRDTKGTRDKAEKWVLEQGEPFVEKAYKNAAIMNALVAALAAVASKKKSPRRNKVSGKYSLTDADFKKIAQAKFTVENLDKQMFKNITSFAGGGKPHAKAPKKETKKAEPKKPKAPAVRDKWDIQKGDWISSKNGMEFNAIVTKVVGNKVHVRYDIEGYGDESYGSDDIGRFISGNSQDGYYAPSWTF